MTIRASRRSAVLPFVLAATFTLSACGDDDIDSVGSAPQTQATQPAGPPAVAASGKGGIPDVTANAKNLKQEPVLAAGTGTPPTKLLTKDLVIGTGEVAQSTATVTVQYVGALYTDGSVFDSSWGGAPAVFPLDQVVPGFAQGIEGMKVGGRREIVIPSALGYGPADQQGIPANSTLVFIVDLVELKQ